MKRVEGISDKNNRDAMACCHWRVCVDNRKNYIMSTVGYENARQKSDFTKRKLEYQTESLAFYLGGK
jgi:hypothetical protein